MRPMITVLSCFFLDVIQLDSQFSPLKLLYRLFSPLPPHVTHGFPLKIKTKIRGCLELNIWKFIADDSTAKYTRECK